MAIPFTNTFSKILVNFGTKEMTNRIIKSILWLYITLQTGAFSYARDFTNKVSIAVISPRNASEKKNSDHWQNMIATILAHQLRADPSIHVLPTTSLKFASDKLNLIPMSPVSVSEARKVGELIEAERVCFGTYKLDNEGWTLSFQILNPVNGNTSGDLVATSKTLMAAIAKLRGLILSQIVVVAGNNESDQLNWPFAHDESALELLSRVDSELIEGRTSAASVEKTLREVLLIDPQFAIARQYLAYNLANDGHLDEADEQAKLAIEEQPNCDSTHFTMGSIYFAKGLNHLAQEELQKAIELDPDWADARVRLAEIFAAQGKTDKVLTALRDAEQLAPYDAEIHARLGVNYAEAGMGGEALKEFVSSEQIPGSSSAVDLLLGQGYETLGDVPKAIEHFTAYVHAIGLDGATSSEIQRRIQVLKARLTPSLLDVLRPKNFDAYVLKSALKERLSPGEQMLVENPLGTNEAIAEKAKELTSNIQGDMEKAQKLFTALMNTTVRGSKFRARTAADVFLHWSESDKSMLCQDYALLYVALARAVGLDAYFVLVDRDYRGKPVAHACAGVFIRGKALLIDPTYRWFGVAHKEFELENDLRVMALFLAESGDTQKENVGLKLAPEWDRIYFLVTIARVQRNEIGAAKEALQRGLKLKGGSPLALYAQGVFAMAENDWNTAVDRLEVFCADNPDYEAVHYDLGRALFFKGELNKAREQYLIYLNGETDPALASWAQEAISYIDKKIDSSESLFIVK